MGRSSLRPLLLGFSTAQAKIEEEERLEFGERKKVSFASSKGEGEREFSTMNELYKERQITEEALEEEEGGE